MAPVREMVPAAPFAEWLNHRLGQLAARAENELNGAIIALVREVGWDCPTVEAGQRKLYRFRHQLMSGSRNGVKGTWPTERFPRFTVEEALHCAGVLFEDLYPEIVAAEATWLEPETWCDRCDDLVCPVDGVCLWCDRRTGPRTGQRLQGKRRRAA